MSRYNSSFDLKLAFATGLGVVQVSNDGVDFGDQAVPK